jgi:hypothetical protein
MLRRRGFARRQPDQLPCAAETGRDSTAQVSALPSARLVFAAHPMILWSQPLVMAAPVPDAEVILPVTCPAGLLPWRVALERRQSVSVLHPSDPFRDLNVRARRNGARIVIGRALNINDPRQHC